MAVAPSSRGGRLEHRVQKALAREHLARFVVTTIGGPEKAPTFRWRVDAGLRRRLEHTRLGRRVLIVCSRSTLIRHPRS